MNNIAARVCPPVSLGRARAACLYKNNKYHIILILFFLSLKHIHSLNVFDNFILIFDTAASS